MATKKYGFLPMDEDDWGNPQFVEKTPKKPRKVEPHVSKANRKRDAKAANFEERWGDEDVLEEKIPKTQSDFPKRMKVSHESGSMNETEEERAQRIDREEREAFVKRLSARDADTTKNLVEDRSSAASSSFSAQRRALADDAAARSAALPDLRERSRQDYLKKRETERLALLRKQVAEETEELRSGVRLSETEKADFAKNREILRIAEERLRIDDHLDGYAMPEDYITEKGKIDRKKKEDAMYKRYVDRDEYGKERYVTEHEEWEREQATKAKAQIQSTERVDQGEYDYLLDEDQGIKWLMDSTLAANGMNKEQAFLAAQLDAAEQRQKSLQETRASLPIAAYREDFLKAFEQSQILVVVGETGSGKTTQLPQYIKEAGYEGVVGCTQPRRVAAMSVAARVADEMGVKLGNEVGYSVRFENKTSQTGNHKTIIKYLTDGLLLREAFSDVLLSEYCCIMVDEAHERTVATDILMGLLKDLARGRPELKILISSATMNAQKFADYFDCDIYNIPGRTFPIRIYHTPTPEANYVQACVSTCLTIHTSQGKGDILVFLTGQEDITLVEEMLTDIARKLGNRIQELIILPLYSTLPSDLQSKVFEPTPEKARKIVLATNIAETSLTIPGVVFVIDAGLQKLSVYNPTTGLSQLIVSPTSKAAANQRAGRAGRVSEGHCFRLYTKYAFETEMDESTAPEILQTNLTSVVLLLKSLGINDILGFDWMDSPASDALIQALESLYALGALNSGGSLTKTGRRLSEMPIDIMAAKAILASGDLGCSEEVTTICAMLGEAEGLFYRPKDKKLLADSARQRFHSEAGDHFVFLNVFSAWAESGFSHIWAKENFLQIRVLNRVRDIRDQMVKINERIEVPMMSAGATNTIPIQKAVTAGFFLNTAILSGGSYRTIKSKSTVYIHPSSVMMGMEPPARVIVYGELVETTKEWMRTCMPIKAEWLMELAPHYFKKSDIEKMEPKKTQKANAALTSAVKAAGPIMFR